MLLNDTFVDKPVVDRLRQFNIRTVEQLLLAGKSGKRVMGLSSALNMSRNEFSDMIHDLEKKYPHLCIELVSKQRRYFTGYRLNNDPLELIEQSLNDDQLE